MSTPGAPRAQAWNLDHVGRFDPGEPLGEGIALQVLPTGRRVLWLPIAAPPARVLAVDVTTPAQPAAIATLALPSTGVCSAASIADDRLALAVRSDRAGASDVGVFLVDAHDPAAPRLLGRYDVSAAHGRGAAHVWFADPATLHVATSTPECVPIDPRDDTHWVALDVADLARPREARRWWLPGTMVGDPAPAPRRVDPRFDTGSRLHSARAWPARPDRVWLAYGDGGLVVLDVAAPGAPRVALRWAHSPPYHGGTHAAVPLGLRGHAIVADATMTDGAADAPKHCWIVDCRADDPARVVPGDASAPRKVIAVGSLPPPPATFAERGGRFGANTLHANPPVRGGLVSDTLVFSTFGNGGVRVHDVSDPWAPVEVAYHVPAGTAAGPSQLHEVLADDRGFVFAVERLAGGLLALSLNL